MSPLSAEEKKVTRLKWRTALGICTLTELAHSCLDQHCKPQLSEQDNAQPQTGWENKGESGTGLQWHTLQLSGGTRQVATKGLLMLWFSHPPPPQGTKVEVTRAGHKIQHLVPLFFAPFGLPAAALTYIFGVVCCRNSAAKLHATCSTRTAQLGTEECDRNVIKSDLSRQFHHKTHLLPHKLKQKLLWGRLLLGWCQQQLLHHSNSNDGRALKSFTRY